MHCSINNCNHALLWVLWHILLNIHKTIHFVFISILNISLLLILAYIWWCICAYLDKIQRGDMNFAQLGWEQINTFSDLTYERQVELLVTLIHGLPWWPLCGTRLILSVLGGISVYFGAVPGVTLSGSWWSCFSGDGSISMSRIRRREMVVWRPGPDSI